MNNNSTPIVVTLPGSLWDRVADSLECDLGRRFGRFAGSGWESRRVGKGSRWTIEATPDQARYMVRYFESLSGINGVGMDVEDRPDARRQSNAAARAARDIRDQLAE